MYNLYKEIIVPLSSRVVHCITVAGESVANHTNTIPDINDLNNQCVGGKHIFRKRYRI